MKAHRKTLDKDPLRRNMTRSFVDARETAGLTQTAVSQRSGIAQADVSRFENGHGNPTVRTLERLADAADADVNVKFTPKGSVQK